MKIITIIILFSISKVFANDTCNQLEEIQMSLSVHASNIVNSKTTRTVEGGAYKKQELVDCESKCRIIKKDLFIKKYLPDHPDADKNGYLELPYFSESVEIHKFVSNMHRLEELGKDKKCGLRYRKLSKGFAIYYKDGLIKRDEFILPQYELISGWSRILGNGKSHLVTFAGEVQSPNLPGESPQ